MDRQREKERELIIDFRPYRPKRDTSGQKEHSSVNRHSKRFSGLKPYSKPEQRSQNNH